MSRFFMNKGENMAMIHKGARIEDDWVMFLPFLQNRADLLPCFLGNLDLKNT